MRKGFWKKLHTPFFALAPMADVTDPSFRRIIAKYGKPDVTWTEFVSADGLCSEKGQQKLVADLRYSEKERPIVAQIFGSNTDTIAKSVKLIKKLGFDGVDINMGCPDRSIEKQGAGAAHMKDPKHAQEVIHAALKAAGSMPVSVKTRIGYEKNSIREWLPYILECEVSAITIHGRTRKEMSKVPAHWDAIGEAVEIAHAYDASKTRPLIIGNGDVASIEDAERNVERYGVDGVMLGRAVFGNPWLFNKKNNIRDIPLTMKLNVLREHTALYERLHGAAKHFDIMKKHFKAYVTGFDGAKELRIELMGAKNAKEVEATIKRFVAKLDIE